MGVLDDKVALITGSGRGIGKAIAMAMAKHGAKVVISDRDETTCMATAEELKAAGAQVMGVVCDVTNTPSIEKMVETISSSWGRIDILVNNAGITRDDLLIRMSEEHWQAVIDTNLTSAFKVSKPVVKVMSKQRSGRIINIASTTGVHGNAGQVNYAAAKAGLIGFTKTVAREYASRGITCNAVAPGFIETDMTAALGQEKINQVVQHIPLGRMGTPNDIAAAVIFFAGPGEYVTGQVIKVDGGLYI
jgi:3-oxoacyl-[acyl-carrier protein] reductase